MLLVGVSILPLFALGVALLFEYSNKEKARTEQFAQQLASNVALIVDAQIEKNLAVLSGLAGSAALLSRNYQAFYEEAQRAVRGTDGVIVLRDMKTLQIFNTQRPFATELPPAVTLSEEELALFRAGKSVTSNVYKSPVSGETRYAVAMPIIDGEGVLLSLTFPTTQIRDALGESTPLGWVSAAGDRNGIYIARSERHGEVTGVPGVKAYLDKAVGKSGFFRETNLFGVPLLAGYRRSNLSGWLIAANIPDQVVSAPFRQALLWTAVAGAFALAISIIGAYAVGRTFLAATVALREQAIAIGNGSVRRSIETPLADLRTVSEALEASSLAIEQRERERDLLTNELNHRVKNTLATVQSLVMNTLRGAEYEFAKQALLSRLLALSRVQDILTAESWAGAQLREIISGIGTAFGTQDRITMQGPSIWLNPNAAMATSLCLHELATNAVKYGSLSTAQGCVDIKWEVGQSDGNLTIVWAEQGGPRVTTPSHQGFGTRLIRSAFGSNQGGLAEVLFNVEGVICRIQLPPSTFFVRADA